MNEAQFAASTRAIPRQLAAGVLVVAGAIVVVAAALTRLLPAAHGPAGPVAAMPQRIAPVARVEIVAASATAAMAADAAAPVATAPASPTAAATPTPTPALAASAPAPSVAPATAPQPPAATGKSGEQVFQATCSVCHASGVAGAPKVGDKAAWAPRLATGLPALGKSAIAGKGAMPPKGGNAGLSDQEVLRAVVYMANQSGATFKEPAAAAAPATVATPASPAAPATAPTPAPAPTAAGAVSGQPAPAAPAPPSPEAPAVVARAEPAAPRINGRLVYQKVCSNCHANGIAGAPRTGDINAWGPRIATGADTMLNNALKGKGAMPPKGGNAKLSEDEVRAALEYMFTQFK